jgi:lysophospholipase L1-like esterase
MRNNTDSSGVFDETNGVTRYLYDEAAVVTAVNSNGDEVWAAPGGVELTDDGLHPNTAGAAALRDNAVTNLLPFLVRA